MLYHQEFLPNYYGDAWIDNQRTFYHISYLQAVTQLLPLLFEENAYSQMHNISSSALSMEPENGEILFWHIRSMAMMGAMDLARKYYVSHKNNLSADQQQMLLYIFDHPH